MGDANSHSLPAGDWDSTPSKDEATVPGGDEEIRWEIVARTPGITPATVIAGRLQVEGFPVRSWQEGAGQALGLTVGILGTGFVAVPEEYADRARRLLDKGEEVWDDEHEAFIDGEEPT